MGPLLLDLVYLTILILGLPFAVYKTLTSARFRAGWCERFGGVPALPEQPRIWVHCASVGEVLLARTFVARLADEYPEADIVISTITSTGREAAEKHLPGRTLFYFPLDFSPVVRRVLSRIRPAAVVLVELELWPNFLAVARSRKIPVTVINGRITDRSARRYRRLGWLARPMFRSVRHFAAQNEQYARRLEELGVERNNITVAGTMKYDSVATEVPADAVAEHRAKLRLRPEDVVLLGGCTHPGEDELLIDYLKQRPAGGAELRLILAPRHRKSADAVERPIREAGLLPVRKTAIDSGEAPDGFEDEPHVILVDTTGELARLYAVATAVFVGGSLVEHGGQNMIEPAALGKPIVFGPHTWNFRDTVDMLLAGGAAVQVDGPDELAPALDELFADAGCRAELGANARRLVEKSKGATGRNFEAVRPFLNLG